MTPDDFSLVPLGGTVSFCKKETVGPTVLHTECGFPRPAPVARNSRPRAVRGKNLARRVRSYARSQGSKVSAPAAGRERAASAGVRAAARARISPAAHKRAKPPQSRCFFMLRTAFRAKVLN